jgi:hypothetical protein
MNRSGDPGVKENAICYKTADTRTGEELLPQERAGNGSLLIVSAAWLWQHREGYEGLGHSRIPTCE